MPHDPTSAPSVAHAVAAGQPAAGFEERRRHWRRRVLKEGKLVFGPNQSAVDCAIDNMSEGGAHIRTADPLRVPQDFYLVEATRGRIHKAEVVWRTRGGIGLKIHGPLEDAAAREALLRRFHRP
jgi:PilZ domain